MKTRILSLLALLRAAPAYSQSVESDLPPEEEAAAKEADHYALPDLADKTLAEAKVVDAKDRFAVKLGFAFLPADYTVFDQDADSITQVGEQEDKYEVRSLRFMARGFLELGRKWNYMVSYEYKGFDKTTDAKWTTTDVLLSTEIDGVGKLSVGKIKEYHSYEMVGDAANLPHSERLLSPFFISRNNGIALSNTMRDQRATWTVGGYWGTGKDATARVTALPMISESGNEYLHVAASVRYHAGDDDKLRFKGKPASNVAKNYVDTGMLDADHAWNTGLEVLWAKGGYSLLGEYITFGAPRVARFAALRRLVPHRGVGALRGAPAVRPQGRIRASRAAQGSLGRARGRRPHRPRSVDLLNTLTETSP